MGRHTRNRGAGLLRQAGSARARAVLSCGLLLGFSTVSTLAYWTDSATLTSSTFTAGSMDLQFDTSGAVGLGTNYAKPAMTFSGLAPSEQKAFNLDVKNVGNPAFRWRATVAQGTTSAWTFVSAPLTVRLYAGRATADTTYPQQDSCTGAALGPAQAVDTTEKSVIDVPQDLAGSGTQQICIVVGLASTATNANQGKSGSIEIDFVAEQRIS